MRFIADECLDGRIERRLIADGHDLVVVRTQLLGYKDSAVLELANARDCLLLTEDKDFGELVFRLRAIHAGVVLVRLHGLPGAEQAELVSRIIREHEERMKNAFTVIGRHGLRIRKA